MKDKKQTLNVFLSNVGLTGHFSKKHLSSKAQETSHSDCFESNFVPTA